MAAEPRLPWELDSEDEGEILDDEEERALHNKQVMSRYRHFRAIKHGYIGLALFLIFMAGYVLVLKGQHQAHSVGDANDSLQIFVEKMKADLKVSDTPSLYKFLCTKIAPAFLKGSWESTTRDGKKIYGRTTNTFSSVIGGLMITAVKRPSHECFRGNPCYSTQALNAPFYTIKVPAKTAIASKEAKMKKSGSGGGKAEDDDFDEPDFFFEADDPDLVLEAALPGQSRSKGSEKNKSSENKKSSETNKSRPVTFSVPYNPNFGGYSICLPSSTSINATSELLAAFAGLFGPDTRELWLHSVLLNPSGIKTVTSFAFGATISIHNKIQFHTKLTTIPYHLYPENGAGHRIALELAVVVYVFYVFVLPLLKYAFCEPQLGDRFLGEDLELSRKWFAWSQEWEMLPVKGGRLRWEMPTLLYIAFFCSVGLWIGLCFTYSKMGHLDDDSFDWLFVDPLAGTGGDLSAKMRASMGALQRNILPFISVVENISKIYNWYFVVQMTVMAFMVLRMQQYFAFQKRLAIVADTFNVIYDDLLHTSIVLFIVCFFFGTIDSLAYGAYDPAFQHGDLSSFWEISLTNFGLFRAAASQMFMESLFKYTPHILSAIQEMSWVPMVLQVVYKAIVFMLLFKLLCGVIMEGYKKHAARLQKNAYTVREDLAELCLAAYHYFWEHLLLGHAYVPFFHVALALSQLQPSDDRRWETSFLGLDGVKAVQDALNAVFDDPSPRVQSQVQNYGLKRCEREEVSFVLYAYGMNRERAEVLFTEYWVKDTKKEIHKKIEKRKHKLQRQSARNVEAQAESSKDDVIGLLNSTRKQMLQSSGENDTDENMANPEKGLDPDYLTMVFKEYDVLNIGTVDHRLMPQLFRMMGFVISVNKLADLLAEYDYNEDGDTCLQEFKEIVCDNRLIGYWVKKPHSSERMIAFAPAKKRHSVLASVNLIASNLKQAD